MKRILIFLLLAPVSLAQTIVQHNSNSSNSATSLVKAYGSNLGSSHLLIAVAGCFANFCNSSSVTSTHNTWTMDLSVNHGLEVSIYHACNSVSGADTVTLTSSGSSFEMHLHIFEISGILTSSCPDQNGTATPNGGTTFTATTSGSVSQSNELLFGAVSANFATPINGTGTWTSIENTATSSYGLATMTSSSTTGLSGTQSVTASVGVAPTQWSGAIITFKSSAAASAPSPINPIVISKNRSEHETNHTFLVASGHNLELRGVGADGHSRHD